MLWNYIRILSNLYQPDLRHTLYVYAWLPRSLLTYGGQKDVSSLEGTKLKKNTYVTVLDGVLDVIESLKTVMRTNVVLIWRGLDAEILETTFSFPKYISFPIVPNRLFSGRTKNNRHFGYPETKITNFKISGTRLGTTLHLCHIILETETEPGTKSRFQYLWLAVLSLDNWTSDATNLHKNNFYGLHLIPGLHRASCFISP